MNVFYKFFMSIVFIGFSLAVNNVFVAKVVDLSKFNDGTLGMYLIYFQEEADNLAMLTLDSLLRQLVENL